MNNITKSLTLCGVIFSIMSGANASNCSGSGFTISVGGGMSRLDASINVGEKLKTKSAKFNEIIKTIKEKAQTEYNNLKKENRKIKKNNVPVVATKSNSGIPIVYDYSYKGEFAANQYMDATESIQAYTLVKDAKYIEPAKELENNQFASNQLDYDRLKTANQLGGPAILTSDKQIGNNDIYVPDNNKVTILLPSGPKVTEFRELVSDKGLTKDGKDQAIDKTRVGEPVKQFFGAAREENIYMLNQITSNANYSTFGALWNTFYSGNETNQKLFFDGTGTQSLNYVNNPWEFSQVTDIKKLNSAYFVDGDKLGAYFVNSLDKSFSSSTDNISNYASTKKWGFYAGVDLGYTVRIGDLYINPYGTASYTRATVKIGDTKDDKGKSTGNPELSSGLGLGLGIKLGYNVTQQISVGILAEYVWTQYKLNVGNSFINALKITDNNLVTFANNLYKLDNKSTIANEINSFNSTIDGYKFGEGQKAWKGAFSAGAFVRFDVTKNVFVSLQGKYMFKHNVSKSIFDGNLETPVQGFKVGVQVGFVF